MFPRARRAHDLIAVLGMRRTEDDGPDPGIAKHFLETGSEREIVFAREGRGLAGIQIHPLEDPKLQASFQQPDDDPAPPAQSDHRNAGALERAGFEPLRFVPRGVTIVLGLITTKTGGVESVDELRRRIDAAARFIPLDQLALSPQCGFASGIVGNLLTEDEQWRKIDVMLETARQVWE